jgi:hypothetical protein
VIEVTVASVSDELSRTHGNRKQPIERLFPRCFEPLSVGLGRWLGLVRHQHTDNHRNDSRPHQNSSGVPNTLARFR